MRRLSSECMRLIALNLVDGLGPVSVKKLLEHAASAENIFSMKARQISEVSGVSRILAEKALSSMESDEYEKEIEYIDNEGINVTCLVDEDYPDSLKDIYDPPLVLFYKGHLPEKTGISVAVVGSRRCSLYGMNLAEKFSGEMSENGVTVVSGMAKGIDSAAHRGVLKSGGCTVAVMGTGFRHIYPEGSEELMEKICRRGAVVTEFSSDTSPARSTFPRRNRIISGMSRGVLVVEAAKRSGALITVDFALEQGKDVFAVPGPVGSVTSLGTNIMIQNGAKLVLSVKDVLDEVAPDILLSKKNEEKDLFSQDDVLAELSIPEGVLNTIPHDQKNVLEAIPVGQSAHIDEIGVLSGIGISCIHKVLLSLEFKGLVKALPGGLYTRQGFSSAGFAKCRGER